MAITRDELADELAATHGIDTDAARLAVDVYADQLADLDGTEIGDDLSDDYADDIRRAVPAQMAVTASGPLDDIAEATDNLHALRIATDDAERAWRIAIRAALAGGQRVVDVADAAGVSRERVYQIRDDRR